MGQFQKSQQVYEVLLDQATNEEGKAPIYHQLGIMKRNQGEYKEAITFYEKSIEIEKKVVPLRHSNLANSYDSIGMVYNNMGENSKALSSHKAYTKN